MANVAKNALKKAVLIRIDKIGDLVSTLPVDQLLRDKGIDNQWIVAEGLDFLLKFANPVRKGMTLPIRQKWKAYRLLKKELLKERPDLAIVYYAPWWVSLALWRAKVPVRAGRRSQWHSFLFFNKGLRQSRSKSKFHEAEYNYALTKFALGFEKYELEKGAAPYLSLEPPRNSVLFEKHDLRPGQYIVVHPGMAGSALNWTQAYYNAMIEKLINAGTVVITGTKMDDLWLNEIRPIWGKHPQVRWLQNELKTEELLVILKNARVVIGPSTGILHLAGATGAPTVGIYSPMTVHSPQRWGPRGPQVTIVQPDVLCPATTECLGPKCKNFYCMDQIKVNQLMMKVFT